jgi:CheY-like chemotaxis protein
MTPQFATIWSKSLQVMIFPSNPQALSVLESMPLMPSLIFLDLMMPVMDGQTFLLELQRNEYYKRFSKIPVIVLSASRFEIFGDVEVYLTKPPHIDEISALAEKYASSTES